VEEEIICEDYARSTHGLDRVRDKIVADLSKNGLDPSFGDTPAEVMKDTFEYINTKFGSVNEYLDTIGFNKQSRELLKMILLHED